MSLAASALGSALGTLVSCALALVSLNEPVGWEAAGLFLIVSSGIFLVGAVIAIPVGLLIGIPMLAGSRPLLPHHTASMTLAFALVGLVGGWLIRDLWGGAGLNGMEPTFGACVGGMHPLVYSRATRGVWPLLSVALLVSAVVIAVPAIGSFAEDVKNVLESREEYEELCADRYNSMAFVADWAGLKKGQGWEPPDGKWRRNPIWHSLYARETHYPLDAAHVLIARDYAYVRGGIAAWLTGGPRVERHCWSEKTGKTVQLLQGHGFGKRPSIGDLAD
jgi:hypothetical protein